MDEYREQTSNSQVFLGAGIAAALLAGLALLLTRKKPKTPAERVSESVETTLAQAREAGQRLIHDAEKSPEVKKAKKKAKKMFGRGKKAGKHLAKDVEVQAEHVAKDVEKRAHHLGRDVEERAHDVEERFERLTRDLEERFQHLTKDLEDRAKRVSKDVKRSGDPTTAAQKLAAQVATVAVDRAARGLKLADSAKDRAPNVAHRVGDDLVPALREIATHAAEAAIERLQEARNLAGEINPGELRHLEHQAANLAHAGGGLARETGHAVAGRARDVSKKAEDAAHLARETTKRTADATVETGKDTGALLFWLGAVLGLIFFVFLNEERREQVTLAVQEFIKDIQGYDDEF